MKHLNYLRNYSRGISQQSWAVRLADFILRKFAGLHILRVQPRTCRVDALDPRVIAGAEEFLEGSPNALDEFFIFLRRNPLFLAQGRAYGCQIGMTGEMRCLMEHRYGKAATDFFDANPMFEIIGATTAIAEPDFAIAQFGRSINPKDCPFVVGRITEKG